MSFVLHVLASALGFVLAAAALFALHELGDWFGHRWAQAELDQREIADADPDRLSGTITTSEAFAADWTGTQSTRESIRRDRDTANDILTAEQRHARGESQ